MFTREELNRNSGKPCYILEFYTAKKQYSYKVDAKDGSIIEAYHFILLADAKKIALDDAGVSEKSPSPRKRWLPAASSRPTITSPLKVPLLVGLTKLTRFWA